MSGASDRDRAGALPPRPLGFVRHDCSLSSRVPPRAPEGHPPSLPRGEGRSRRQAGSVSRLHQQVATTACRQLTRKPLSIVAQQLREHGLLTLRNRKPLEKGLLRRKATPGGKPFHVVLRATNEHRRQLLVWGRDLQLVLYQRRDRQPTPEEVVEARRRLGKEAWGRLMAAKMAVEAILAGWDREGLHFRNHFYAIADPDQSLEAVAIVTPRPAHLYWEWLVSPRRYTASYHLPGRWTLTGAGTACVRMVAQLAQGYAQLQSRAAGFAVEPAIRGSPFRCAIDFWQEMGPTWEPNPRDDWLWFTIAGASLAALAEGRRPVASKVPPELLPVIKRFDEGQPRAPQS